MHLLMEKGEMLMLRGEVIVNPMEKMILDLSYLMGSGANPQQESDMVKEATMRIWRVTGVSRRLASRFPKSHEIQVGRRELRGRDMR